MASLSASESPPDAVPRVVHPDRVRAARAALPAEKSVGELADVLALLGDPTRLRLLVTLLGAGEMCVADLAAVTGQSESAVSHALRLLRAHRIVAVRRERRLAYYRLDDTHVRQLLAVGLAHIGHDGGADAEISATDGAEGSVAK